MPEISTTYAEVSAAVNQLTIMGQRLLPSMQVEGRVSRALRACKEPVELYQADTVAANKHHVKRDAEGKPISSADGKGEQVADQSAYQEEMARIGKTPCVVEIAQLFVEADLPQDRDTKPGNGDGRVQMRLGLGPFFDWG